MLNGTLGFAMIIAILFCMPSDIPDTLEAVTFYPFMSIYTYAVGSTAGATAMVSSASIPENGGRAFHNVSDPWLTSLGLCHHRDPIFCHRRPRCHSLPHAVGLRP